MDFAIRWILKLLSFAAKAKAERIQIINRPTLRKQPRALFCHQNVRLTHESGSGAMPVKIPLVALFPAHSDYGMPSQMPTDSDTRISRGDCAGTILGMPVILRMSASPTARCLAGMPVNL